jgi:hypothetical protein
MTRDEIIALIATKALQYGEAPVEILGGVIAESALNPDAARYGVWPDVSFGLLQQTVKFADEGDHSDSAVNIDLIRRLYSDPVHALDVGIKKFAYWRHDPEISALDAWCRYNWPAREPSLNPNRANYANGLAEAQRILGATPMPVKFDPNYPAVIQDDDWSCAPTALTWAMRSLGRQPAHGFIENDMLRLGLVTKELGLMNHTGAGIVTWLQINDAQHYGSDGYGISNNQNPISWDHLVPEINPRPPYPLLLGLPNWGGPGRGHWAGVRGFDPSRGMILLANPDNGPTFGVTELTRQQFEARAGNNASIVRVLHPDLLEATPPPPPPPPPKGLTRAEIDAVIATLQGWRERVSA